MLPVSSLSLTETVDSIVHQSFMTGKPLFAALRHKVNASLNRFESARAIPKLIRSQKSQTEKDYYS